MEFIPYRKFFEEGQALELIALLQENEIPYDVYENRENLEAYFGDRQIRKQLFVKIRKEDFEKVDEMLLSQAKQQLKNIEQDHYLFSFSDEELFDVIAKPDEWNELDYQLAQAILKERGREVDAQTLERLKQERIKELAKPEDRYRAWIAIGYILAFFGGLFGIFIGWHLASYKKILPNGQRVYGFSVNDRSHGRRIIIIGTIMLVISLIIRFISDDSNS